MPVGADLDFQRTLGRLAPHANVGQCHGHQQQRGKDQHRNPDTGGDGQVLDHRNIDQHQHRKAHRIGQQRGDTGNKQTTKGVARSNQLVGATGNVLHDAVHLLRRMGHADGEDQKRHQHRVRVNRIAQPGNDAQLPDHRDQRAAHHQQGAAHATGVEVDDQQRGDYGQGKEHHYLDQAIDQVAHQLGKTDHANLVLSAALLPGLAGGAVPAELDTVAQLLFEQAGELLVVDALTGGRGGVQQGHDQHAGFEVAGHQAADDPGSANVLAQLFDVGSRALVSTGHHRATLKAFFGDFGPAYAWAPQRLHPYPVNPSGDKQLVIDLLEYVQVTRVENIPLGVLHHYPHRVAQTAQ